MKTRSVLAAGTLIVLVVLVSACSSPQPATPAKEQPAPKAKTPDELVKWYQDCWNDFNEKKWDDFKKCYADNATSQQGGYGAVNATGPDKIVAGSQDFAKTFPDGRGEGQMIFVNGNRIASIYLLKGTNSGPLHNPDGKEMPATNKKFGLLFGHYIEFDPAAPKVTKEVGEMDGTTVAAQLGLMKVPTHPVMETGAPMPTVVIAKNDDNEMKNVAAANAQMDAWNKHDGPTVDMYFADDYVYHDVAGPKDQNKAQASQMNKDYWKGFSDAKINPTSTWAAGDYVVIIGNYDGTNDGDFAPMKLKKTGKKASVPFIDMYKFDGGKIKEEWLFFDTANFAAQLGVK